MSALNLAVSQKVLVAVLIMFIVVATTADGVDGSGSHYSSSGSGATGVIAKGDFNVTVTGFKGAELRIDFSQLISVKALIGIIFGREASTSWVQPGAPPGTVTAGLTACLSRRFSDCFYITFLQPPSQGELETSAGKEVFFGFNTDEETRGVFVYKEEPSYTDYSGYGLQPSKYEVGIVEELAFTVWYEPSGIKVATGELTIAVANRPPVASTRAYFVLVDSNGETELPGLAFSDPDSSARNQEELDGRVTIARSTCCGAVLSWKDYGDQNMSVVSFPMPLQDSVGPAVTSFDFQVVDVAGATSLPATATIVGVASPMSGSPLLSVSPIVVEDTRVFCLLAVPCTFRVLVSSLWVADNDSRSHYVDLAIAQQPSTGSLYIDGTSTNTKNAVAVPMYYTPPSDVERAVFTTTAIVQGVLVRRDDTVPVARRNATLVVHWNRAPKLVCANTAVYNSTTLESSIVDAEGKAVSWQLLVPAFNTSLQGLQGMSVQLKTPIRFVVVAVTDARGNDVGTLAPATAPDLSMPSEASATSTLDDAAFAAIPVVWPRSPWHHRALQRPLLVGDAVNEWDVVWAAEEALPLGGSGVAAAAAKVTLRATYGDSSSAAGLCEFSIAGFNPLLSGASPKDEAARYSLTVVHDDDPLRSGDYSSSSVYSAGIEVPVTDERADCKVRPQSAPALPPLALQPSVRGNVFRTFLNGVWASLVSRVRYSPAEAVLPVAALSVPRACANASAFTVPNLEGAATAPAVLAAAVSRISIVAQQSVLVFSPSYLAPAPMHRLHLTSLVTDASPSTRQAATCLTMDLVRGENHAPTLDRAEEGCSVVEVPTFSQALLAPLDGATMTAVEMPYGTNATVWLRVTDDDEDPVDVLVAVPPRLGTIAGGALLVRSASHCAAVTLLAPEKRRSRGAIDEDVVRLVASDGVAVSQPLVLRVTYVGSAEARALRASRWASLPVVLMAVMAGALGVYGLLRHRLMAGKSLLPFSSAAFAAVSTADEDAVASDSGPAVQAADQGAEHRIVGGVGEDENEMLEVHPAAQEPEDGQERPSQPGKED